MKEKDFSGADLPLFSLEASVQLAFLTLIVAQKSSRERHLILFLSSIQPQTLLFTQPTKFYPSKQKTLARIRGPKIKSGRILRVRKCLFNNYLLQDRLEDNQFIKQIQRLGVYPALLQNTQRIEVGKAIILLLPKFFLRKTTPVLQAISMFSREIKAQSEGSTLP